MGSGTIVSGGSRVVITGLGSPEDRVWQPLDGKCSNIVSGGSRVVITGVGPGSPDHRWGVAIFACGPRVGNTD